ncbi:hypothetical protein [Burkholderia catarinensis]|uniref:hypothetical protein n=1 Tax=Burkholderia catarinensis TaxID=1108140 RepID=UPI00100859BC|nr:hypothetical protein [Burkholderia catarinensis]
MVNNSATLRGRRIIFIVASAIAISIGAFASTSYAAGVATRLKIVAGDNVAVLTGNNGPTLRVRALAADDSPAAGSVIEFRAIDKKAVSLGSNGDFSARATTNEQGYADVPVGRLQSGAGQYLIQAEAVNGAALPVTFSVFAVQASHLSINAGANQTGIYTHTPACNGGDGFYATSVPVSVLATDDAGHPVQGVPISWAVNLPNNFSMNNCNAFSNGSCVTDASGVSSGYPFIGYNYIQNGAHICTTTFPSSYSLTATISGTGASVSIPENLQGR